MYRVELVNMTGGRLSISPLFVTLADAQTRAVMSWGQLHDQGGRDHRAEISDTNAPGVLIDAVDTYSYAQGYKTVNQVAEGVNAQALDDPEGDYGDETADNDYFLTVTADGYARVVGLYDDDGRLTADADPAGDFMFRAGDDAPFDVPQGNTRRFRYAKPDDVIEAQDGQAETPTLSNIVPVDTYAYPPPICRFGVVQGVDDGTGGTVPVLRTPSPVPQGDIFGPLPVLELHDQQGPVEFGETAQIKYNDRYLWGNSDETRPELGRLGNVYFARPFTPLPDDDGHTAGYFFKGIEVTYDWANRIVSYTLETRAGGMTQAKHTFKSDKAHVRDVRYLLQPGTSQIALYDPKQGTANPPSDWRPAPGPEYPDPAGPPGKMLPLYPYNAFPNAGAGVPEAEFDPDTVQYREDYIIWDTQIVYRAVYVERLVDGREFVYKSVPGRSRARVTPCRQYPVIPVTLPPFDGRVSGASGQMIWTEYHAYNGDAGDNTFAFAFDGDAYQPGDTLTAQIPFMAGQVAGHFFLNRIGTNYAHEYPSQRPPEGEYGAYDDAANATGPVQLMRFDGGERCTPCADPWGYYLLHGETMPGACSNVRDLVQRDGRVDLGDGGAAYIECHMHPIFGTYANGGTVPYETDTVTYTGADGTVLESSCTGPFPVTMVSAFRFAPHMPTQAYPYQWQSLMAAGARLGQAGWEGSAANGNAGATGQPSNPNIGEVYMNWDGGAQGDTGCGPGQPPAPPPPKPKVPYKGVVHCWCLHKGDGRPIPLYDATDGSKVVLSDPAPLGLSAAYYDADDHYPGPELLLGIVNVPTTVPTPTGTRFIGWAAKRSVPRLGDGGGFDEVYTGPIFAPGPYTLYINSDDSLTVDNLPPNGIIPPVHVGGYDQGDALKVGSFKDSYGATIEVFDRPVFRAGTGT